MLHVYRLTAQKLNEACDESAGSLSFCVSNHDDLMHVLSRVRERKVVPDDEAAEFTVGLKLFSGVLLRHRCEPLFAELLPHFGNFLKKLKGRDVSQA